MSKHHHQSREEQINNTRHDAVQFQRERTPYQGSRLTREEDHARKTVVEGSSIQLRAYELYCEKGGSALDNWLEAERILNNIDPAVSGFMSEGNPNTQK